MVPSGVYVFSVAIYMYAYEHTTVDCPLHIILCHIVVHQLRTSIQHDTRTRTLHLQPPHNSKNPHRCQTSAFQYAVRRDESWEFNDPPGKLTIT